MDERVWPWDQAWYGQVSVELFYTLLYSPATWPTALGRAFAIKAPGIAWVGQWFVPFGVFAGGTNQALLISILLIQLATLWLVYASLARLCGGGRGVPLIGALLVAAGPLFVGLTHQYVVEPLQTLAVAWFVFLMVGAPRLGPTELLLQLIAASGLGMLAKVTSPLYCLGPGAVILFDIYRGYRRVPRLDDPGRHDAKIRVGVTAILALGFGLGAVAWYSANLQAIVSFTALAYSSPVAALYGAHDTFSNKLGYWLGAVRSSFTYPLGSVAAVTLCTLAIGRRMALGRLGRLDPSVSRLDLCALVGIVEVLLVLASFSAGDNEETRYLMPLAPFLALLLCWLLVQIRSHWLTVVTAGLVVVQAATVNAQAMSLSGPSSDVSPWLYAVDRDGTRAREIDSLVDIICTPSSIARYTIVGVEEPWFNANTLAYVSAQRHEREAIRCYYTSLGYAESDPQRAWDRLIALNTLYYAALAPEVRLTSPLALNQVSAPILDRLESSGAYDLVPAIRDPAVLLFRHRED